MTRSIIWCLLMLAFLVGCGGGGSRTIAAGTGGNSQANNVGNSQGNNGGNNNNSGSGELPSIPVMYSVQNVGQASGGNSVQGTALNDSGQVVGANGFGHACVWSGGILKDLDNAVTQPGNGVTEVLFDATGIDNSGVICGDANLYRIVGGKEENTYLPFTFAQSQPAGSQIELLGSLPSGTATGINANGLVVGPEYRVDPNSGIVTQIPFACTAINTQGQVVGSSSLFSGASTTSVGTLGGTNCTALGINDNTEVVGFSDMSSGLSHAFLWKSGVMTDLGTLGGTTSRAMGINDSGLIVGSSLSSTGGTQHAFVSNGSRMIDLNTLVPANSQTVLSIAVAINKSGQIVCNGTGSSGTCFLLTPQ